MNERENNQEIIDIARRLKNTFVNRSDCFSVQLDDGRYFSNKKELITNHIIGHLKGNITLGVYLLGTDATAKYTVIDADSDEEFNKMRPTHEALPSYLETSRRGGHLWFFFEKPIPGKVAKNFGLEIAKRFSLNAEVFPKQSESSGPGSCIRLPFGIHKKTGERYPFVGLGNWRRQLQALSDPVKVPMGVVEKYQYQEPQKIRRNPFNGELPLWEKVKRQITVMELVENYVELNGKGVGKCPFHDDRVPSFSVNEKENYWNCFSGCGGGSVIDFWMRLNKLEFMEAVEDLSERLGVR